MPPAVPDLREELNSYFHTAMRAAFGDDHADVDPLVRPSVNAKFGDFQANVAMSLARPLGKAPRELARVLLDALDRGDWCESADVAGPGFVNVRLRPEFLGRCVRGALDDARLGVPVTARSETVVVDYSAPNVAKEMHVGHLRSTIIGDSIARTLEFLGHRVIRQNHLGDWGTQFGMLIEHLIDEGWVRSGEHSIRDLNALYQAAKRKFDCDAAFAERSRQRVVLLQGGDETTRTLWQGLIAESQRHFDEVYARLGVQLTSGDVRGESSYNALLGDVVGELQARGLTEVSDGALCVFLDGFKAADGSPLPLLVRKSDGGYLYATTDLAALRYRLVALGAQRIVYVTDARQKQHFAMVFEAGRRAGWLDAGAHAEHVSFGMVLGDDGKPFKTRSGETVRLVDLLDETEQRAYAVVSEKVSSLDEEARRRIARVVGIGAIKYADLSNDRVKDYTFSWARMLSFDGNTAPYLQNAYVRIRSIFRRANLAGAPVGATVLPSEPAERALALQLLQYPDAVRAVAETLEPHRLCTYLYELAAAYHQFYERCPVLTAAAPGVRDSRLALSDLCARTLEHGLGLLGIGVVEQM